MSSDNDQPSEVHGAPVFAFLMFFTILWSAGVPLSGIFLFAQNWKLTITLAAVLTAAGLGFCAVVKFYGKYYDKNILSIKKSLEALTKTKQPAFPFLPPKSIRAISLDRIRPIENKIWSIGQRIVKTSDYIQLLRDNKDRNDANEIKKQKETIKYFIKYYDDYGALYLNVKLQFYIEIIREILIKGKQIYTIDMRNFIDTMQGSIKAAKDELIWYVMLIDSGISDEELAAINNGSYNIAIFLSLEHYRRIHDLIDKWNERKDELYERDIKRLSDVYLKRKQGYADGCKKISKTMEKIDGDINIIMNNLIAIQSGGIIARTSPIDDEHLLEIDKREHELKQVIDLSASLDNEYDRFAAEMELTGK